MTRWSLSKASRLRWVSLVLVTACSAPTIDGPTTDLGEDGPRDASTVDRLTVDRPSTVDVAPIDSALPADVTPRDVTPRDVAPMDLPRVDAGPDVRARDVVDVPPAIDAGPPVATGTNPVIAGDAPDPHVLRTVIDGRVTYYLTATVHDGGDYPLYRSYDLVRWTRLPRGLFQRSRTPGRSIALGDRHYCSLWAPEITEIAPSSYLLSFTAQRFTSPQSSCPAPRDNTGVYLAWSPSPEGPFARSDHPWEPLPAGGQLGVCPTAIRDAIPRSLDTNSRNCQGGYCHQVIRLDSTVWRDPDTGRWWMGYSWYTNDPPLVAWERTHHGEHVSLVEVRREDPFAVICSTSVAQVFVGQSHDDALLTTLRGSCPRCGEMLAFDRGRQGERMSRGGSSWAVNEGPSLLRHDGWVYALMSGSAWDSAYYSVFWVAARTVEDLSWESGRRIAGRFLVPSRGMAFGHGSPVLGPDGRSWFYVHHRLRAEACRASGDCARDVWVTPIVFEDRGDGRGAVWIQARFPAEEGSVRVPLG